MSRAQHTARLILDAGGRDHSELHLDTRLRETCKGARQGFSKLWTEEQALQERKRLGFSEEIPMNETHDAGWTRIREWLNCVLQEALDERLFSDLNDFNILVVAHAGILRILLTRLLGDELLRRHPAVRYERDLGRLLIPNTSVTILDLTPRVTGSKIDPIPFDGPYEYVKIDTLTWAVHNDSIELNVANDC